MVGDMVNNQENYQNLNFQLELDVLMTDITSRLNPVILVVKHEVKCQNVGSHKQHSRRTQFKGR